jgi:hypothetical protein
MTLLDPAMNEALMAMLPVEVRTALEGGASPEEVAQSLVMQRMNGTDQPHSSVEIVEVEEPWPEVGWIDGEMPSYEPAGAPPALSSAVAAPAVPVVDQRVCELARALGACALCLGEAPDCPVCVGNGSPGWNVPEPHLFALLVTPALQRLAEVELREAQAAARRFSPPGPTHNANGHSTTD